MKRLTLPLIGLMAILVTSCVSKKKYTELQGKFENSKSELLKTRTAKQQCQDKLSKIQERVSGYYAKINALKDENEKKLAMTDNGAVVSKKAKKAMRKTLRNVDPQKLAAAKTVGDSMDLAVSYNLQKSLGGEDDDGSININVDHTVVEITISNSLLFRSGSYWVNPKADKLLSKISELAKSEPAVEIMVEGHTDSHTVVKGTYFKDNWGLSVRRAAAVVRILQNKFGVDGKQLIAAGRSSYHPIADNDTAAGRKKNRRTRIIILPNLDKFLALLGQA